MKNRTVAYRAHQHTIDRQVDFVGIGLHTGRRVSMAIQPAGPGTGIQFHRIDAEPGRRVIQAHWSNVTDTRLCTVIGNPWGVTVSTVEHLMAAFTGCGIDNAIVRVNGPEVPVLDGSAGPIVRMLQWAGVRPQSRARRYAVIRRLVEVSLDDTYAVAMPDAVTGITVSIDFPGRAVGYQKCRMELTEEVFARELAPARTFGFEHDLDSMRVCGQAQGASLQNAVLVNGERVVNPEGLRFADEFVRHKALGLVGDLGLLGAPFVGHIVAHRPGHWANAALLIALLREQDAIEYVTGEALSRSDGTVRGRAGPRWHGRPNPAAGLSASPTH